MANLDYPNDEAVALIGVLDKWDAEHGHEKGWAASVIAKIHADILNASRNDSEPFDRENYSAEELAAWDYYQAEVIPIDKWDALVKEFRNSGNVDYDDYNPDTDYIGKPDPSFAPPANIHEYSGESGGGDLVVTTEAIEYFCKQLDTVAPQGKDGIVWQAINKLDALDIKPGTFGKAVAMRNKVTGTPGSSSDGGLRGDTRGLLVNVHEALFDLQKSLRAMVKEYDSAEEFNALTGQQFAEAMDEAWGDITKFSKYGNTDTTTQGGNGEEGGDGAGN